MNDKYKAKDCMLQSHLTAHRHNLKDLISKYTLVSENLKNKVGIIYTV